MAFNFDLEAATNQIATIERTMLATLPSAGTLAPTTVYDHLQSPGIVPDADLPAIVHVPHFPGPADGVPSGARTAHNLYSAQQTVDSLFLILEALPEQNQFQDAFGIAVSFATEYYNAFLNDTAKGTLIQASNAQDYQLRFPDGNLTLAIRTWPPVSPGQAQKQYWSYMFNHYFRIESCN